MAARVDIDAAACQPAAQGRTGVTLFANRFAVAESGRATDLATGTEVMLIEATAGGDSDERQWTIRCDLLHRLHHPDRARLVDFGPIGEHRRFEAWTPGARWSDDDIAACAGEAMMLPDAAGVPRSLRACALEMIARPSLAAVSELVEPTSSARPNVIAVWGPPGAGMRTAVTHLARTARLGGMVPIRADLFTPPVQAIVSGCTLLIIADAAGHGWRILLSALAEWPRPHVLVLTAVEEVAGVPSIGLGRVSAAQLAGAVRPRSLPPSISTQVREAAELAAGLPGRFARLIWGDLRERSNAGAPRRPGRGPAQAVRAAEQPAVYETAVSTVPAAVRTAAWASAAEIASLTRRRDESLALVARGLHAEGERTLRQTAAALARREAWKEATDTGLALVDAIARRGRVREAQRVLADARDWARRAEDEGRLTDVAIRAGRLWIDAVRFDEAEAALAGASAYARACGDDDRSAAAALATARAWFWRGRYADAEDHLRCRAGPKAAGEHDVRVQIAVSRCAIGVRDYARGIALALDAVQRALRSGSEQLATEASCAAAFAHLAVNDVEAVERDVRHCVAAARRSHAPLVAVRGRLLGAEAARRAGRVSAAREVIRRLTGMSAERMPPILAARRDLLSALLESDRAGLDAVADRHVQQTGLAALALFAPASSRASAAGVDEDGLLEVVAILAACQTADDEARVLTDVCARVRRRLQAASVALVTTDGTRLAVVAADGARPETDIAARAISAASPIPPHRVADRLEAAVPVAYGGTVIGALAVRWTLASAYPSRAVPLLTLIATAAAPVLAALRAARPQAAPGPTEIVGVSQATADLRAAIERTASAPFSVLIEGESGSGKELVARAVHRRSSRRDRPFCPVNCAALPDDLVEAELFGHARGAFTGAAGERRGVFEDADGGSLFLDEIGELSPRAQAKILRVIQEGEFRRIGESTVRRADVRIIAATNRNLRDEVAAGRFRLDLLYRLDVLRIVVLPLRDRRDDIPALIDHFWRELTGRIGSRAALSPAVVSLLGRYDWPGNVRELQNVLASLAVRSPQRGIVTPAALPAGFAEAGRGGDQEEWRLDRARRTFEARFVRAALVRTGGRRAQAAAELGLTRQGLAKLMARLGISD